MSNQQAPIPLPNIFIGNEKVRQRVNLYLQNKRPLLNQTIIINGVQKEETKSIWYSKEHMETLLNEINLMNGDGMRIYFGAYENDNDLAPGQLCLLMVVTRTGEDPKVHKDVVYENEPGFADRVKATTQSRDFDNSNLNAKEEPREFNYGAPCPPIC